MTDIVDGKAPTSISNDSKKKHRECKIQTCIKRTHGVFPVCKNHFREGVTRFKWKPSHVGLQTLNSISFIHEMFDLDRVTENDIEDTEDIGIPGDMFTGMRI
jgi:hypothetical protein